MNAGPDVERSIAQWLSEESPGRAPDRILANAGSAIDRTKQRRLAVAWREPVTISLRWVALAAAVVIVAVVGAGFVGRSTASVGTQATPSPVVTSAPSPTAHVATLAEYKAARDAICIAARPERATYDARIGQGLTDPKTPADARAVKLQAFQEFLAWAGILTGRLHALDVPPSMGADEQAVYASAEATLTILDQEVALIQAGKYSEADAVDQTTNATNSITEAFERKYNLEPCP